MMIAELISTALSVRLSIGSMLRDGRVVAAGVERMALRKPFQRARRSAPGSVVAKALLRIERAARVEAAARAERVENGREHEPVQGQGAQQYQPDNLRHSFSISLATSTSSPLAA